jgi:hypothetical protein
MTFGHRTCLCLGILALIQVGNDAFAATTQKEADYEWVEQNIQRVPNDLLPMDSPDSNGPEQESITFRYINSILIASREYSFSLIRRSYERPGPLIFYWVARVRMADGAPVRTQLTQLHAQNPSTYLTGLEPQLKIKTWSFDEKT